MSLCWHIPHSCVIGEPSQCPGGAPFPSWGWMGMPTPCPPLGLALPLNRLAQRHGRSNAWNVAHGVGCSGCSKVVFSTDELFTWWHEFALKACNGSFQELFTNIFWIYVCSRSGWSLGRNSLYLPNAFRKEWHIPLSINKKDPFFLFYSRIPLIIFWGDLWLSYAISIFLYLQKCSVDRYPPGVYKHILLGCD